jgi:hypothetical protein
MFLGLTQLTLQGRPYVLEDGIGSEVPYLLIFMVNQENKNS